MSNPTEQTKQEFCAVIELWEHIDLEMFVKEMVRTNNIPQDVMQPIIDAQRKWELDHPR